MMVYNVASWSGHTVAMRKTNYSTKNISHAQPALRMLQQSLLTETGRCIDSVGLKGTAAYSITLI